MSCVRVLGLEEKTVSLTRRMMNQLYLQRVQWKEGGRMWAHHIIHHVKKK